MKGQNYTSTPPWALGLYRDPFTFFFTVYITEELQQEMFAVLIEVSKEL
jgi:hypothetical protein